MTDFGVQTYRAVAAQTASRGELLIALHDGALRYAGQARAAMVQGDAAAKGRHLDALMAVIAELQATLEPAHAPELCENLSRLYTYFMRRLQHAGLHMELAPLDEVTGHLQALRTTWSQAVHQTGEPPAHQP